MKLHQFHRLWVFLLIFLGFRSYIGDSSISENSEFSPLRTYGDNSEGLTQTGGRSLLSLPLKSIGNTALVAALNGEVHLVDSNSMKIIWSFTSGPPICSSYQSPMKHNSNKESASDSNSPFFFDCGDDGELYMHTKHGRTKLPSTIDEVVRNTPYILEDGSVMTGSRTTTVFEIDPVTGKRIRNHTSDFPPSELSNENHSTFSGNKSKKNRDDKDLIEPGFINSIEPRLYITRTDYSLKSSFADSEEVSWSLTIAEIGATLLCPDDENPSKNAHWNLKSNSDYDVDFDFSMPLSCPSKVFVYRERRHILPESPDYKRLPEAHNTDNMPLVPVSSLMLPSHSRVDKNLNFHPEQLMLTGPTSDVDSSLHSSASSSPYNYSEAAVPMPLMPINDARILQGQEIVTPNADFLSMVLNGPVGLSFIFFITMLVGLTSFGIALLGKVRQFFFRERLSDSSNLKMISPKRKRTRKSGRSNGNSEKNKDVSISSENENAHDDANGCGRWIGKLFVTNIEIAKGSNGTIVLEGKYDGREVAVKRLVKSHHDVASKEVQNLIISDRHPNIIRWYGEEYDQDFVYLSLERCNCSLDDLIQICSNPSLNSMFSHDQDMGHMVQYKQRLELVRNDMPNLNLWRQNGHPSALLLKLMRDMVAGLEHLHELGIIHRDLKPQNVLILKHKTINAKLSDMGISKRLKEDMSSLGHCATGCGSSGWQAPEQLLHKRQTRAVDLFSLGCVLFFCMTGGKHPFGDHFERDNNVVKNKMDLFLVEGIPEAIDLISRLLNPDPDLRPKASEVLHHPLFWSSEIRLSFLRDTSDRMELEDRETVSDLLTALENIAPKAVGARWDEKMEPAFITNIGHYRRYKYDSVRDLLRVMRNKLNHYRELPKEIQELVGPVPKGFDNYFASRFPRLLIEVYKIVSKHCREEDSFQKYFRGQIE